MVATLVFTTAFLFYFCLKVNAVKFNFESTLLFSASVDGTCKVWDLRGRSYDPTQTLNESKDTVTSLFLSDYQILTGSADCCIRRYALNEMCSHRSSKSIA